MRGIAHAVLGVVLVAAAPASGLAADGPLASLPYTPGLDPGAMDRGADPCVDFYQYACGGWMRSNPIPSDQARWSVYDKLDDGTQRFLWGILEDVARPEPGRSGDQARVGDFFAACMDEGTVEGRGAEPMRPWLERIRALRSTKELPALLADLHLAWPAGDLLFSFGSNQDFGDAEQVIAFADAGGLGLPDRDYYTARDARSKQLRTAYAAHVARMLQLGGDDAAVARAGADRILRLETALAKAQLTRVERRDPRKLHHAMDLAGLQALTPRFDWAAYLAALGAPVGRLNVSEPAFYREVDRQLRTVPLADLRTYLRWQTLHAAARYLSAPFVEADFAFYGKTLHGVPALRPRWKRCVTLVDAQLGEALGKEFVARAFSPELKERTLRMTRLVQRAMEGELASLDWMGPETKRRAAEKLRTMVNKIGYPERWRDYSSVEVRRDDHLGNVVRTNRFEVRRQLAKIGKPLDRGEWQMTPPTVNAYYNAQMNDMNFPAGILQPPLYDPRLDDAPAYGNTGATIGHELTHGFDDEGRQYDAKGNLTDWWTPADAKAFEERTRCIVEQYGRYVVVDDVHVNARLTLGEDVADLGGLVLAWSAWREGTKGAALAPADGLSPEQRFFVGYAQWACANERPENLRAMALTDPHSPFRYRVNGPLANLPEFERAFACKAGQPMVRAQRCRVW
jgi:endothelin-converting enzyme/putative endopeptidase